MFFRGVEFRKVSSEGMLHYFHKTKVQKKMRHQLFQTKQQL